MSKDHATVDIAKWETINGVEVPVDEWGHYLDPDTVNEEKTQADTLTDPYGIMNYAVGNAEGDEHCDGDFTTFFDFAELPDRRIVLHSVVNTESGGYIGDGEYEICSRDEAVTVAMGMVDSAMDAVDINDVRHDEEGWNQTPCFFWRSISDYLKGKHGTTGRILS